LGDDTVNPVKASGGVAETGAELEAETGELMGAVSKNNNAAKVKMIRPPLQKSHPHFSLTRNPSLLAYPTLPKPHLKLYA
jgi:hypothetical protein